MNIGGEELGFGGAIVGIVAAGLKWMRSRLDRERDDCRKDNVALAARLQAIEDRSHTENRDDRQKLIAVMDMNARAFNRLSERLTDTTPPHGNHR